MVLRHECARWSGLLRATVLSDNYIAPSCCLIAGCYPRSSCRSHRWCDLQRERWLREHQPPSGETSPLFHPSLESPQLSRRQFRAFAAKPFQQLLGGSVGLGLQPRDHARPLRLERVASSSPVSLGLRSSAVRRSDLAVLPRGREAAQEVFEVCITMR